MFRITNPNPNKFINWFAKDANECKRGTLVKSNSGADPVAAAHTGATLLGVVVEDQLSANGKVMIHGINGVVLEVDYDPTATKQTFAVTDLGTQYDLVADSTTGEQFVDPDDTTGGFLILVGYNNDKKIAYVTVDAADCLLPV